ncbi:hypothetical protein RJ45_05535 [Photobacterium gaetbulicola]|uniref:Uncharacterized protein n=1 Tax=Photobacterium gaetbulicola TaxID=1295392 RepID=A0A0B9H6Y3_9GAMM|nr:hypothetical protein RJ45_05535 [Photobacterium gaetbulicola]
MISGLQKLIIFLRRGEGKWRCCRGVQVGGALVKVLILMSIKANLCSWAVPRNKNRPPKEPAQQSRLVAAALI